MEAFPKATSAVAVKTDLRVSPKAELTALSIVGWGLLLSKGSFRNNLQHRRQRKIQGD